MIKFILNENTYWVGYTVANGHLVFDATIQNGGDSIRLYVVKNYKCTSFIKDAIRPALINNNKLNESFCYEALIPYTRAVERTIHHERCATCDSILLQGDFSICNKCERVLCTCGKCGCKRGYSRY